MRSISLGVCCICLMFITPNVSNFTLFYPANMFGFQAGIATLFNALYIYTVNYHSMAIHLRPVCKVRLDMIYLFIYLNNFYQIICLIKR